MDAGTFLEAGEDVTPGTDSAFGLDTRHGVAEEIGR